VTGFAGAVATAQAILGKGRHRALRDLQTQLALHRAVRRIVGRFDVDDYRRLLDYLDTYALSLLGEVSRDEIGPLLGRLIVHRPQFLALALRAIWQQKQRQPRSPVGARSSLTSAFELGPSATQPEAPPEGNIAGIVDSTVDR